MRAGPLYNIIRNGDGRCHRLESRYTTHTRVSDAAMQAHTAITMPGPV